jgi:hypothetical protein
MSYQLLLENTGSIKKHPNSLQFLICNSNRNILKPTTAIARKSLKNVSAFCVALQDVKIQNLEKIKNYIEL